MSLGYWGELEENKDNKTKVEVKNLRLKHEEFIRICLGKGIINEALQDHIINNLNKNDWYKKYDTSYLLFIIILIPYFL